MVTGCCIGAGMIGLPVLSAASGFLPSSLAMLFSYLFTTASGLLLLEAALWFDQKVNLFTIAQFALGRFGKALIGSLFLFLFYSLFVAYLDAGGQLLGSALSALFPLPNPKLAGMILSPLLVSAIIYRGVGAVDLVNRFLLLGLVASYLLLLIVGLPHVEVANLEHTNWSLSLMTLPILFISFGYQNLVPSLVSHLRQNVKLLRLVIVVGNGIPLLFYLLWNFVILGMIAEPGVAGSGIVSELLEKAHSSASVLYWVNAFSFFALFTSFITIALSFVDFVRDGFTKPPSELILHALVLLPPLVICLLVPNLFLQALNFAGGFVDVLLFGILPVVIVWMGRYAKGIQGAYQVAGGKPFLVAMFLLSLALLLMGIS